MFFLSILRLKKLVFGVNHRHFAIVVYQTSLCYGNKMLLTSYVHIEIGIHAFLYTPKKMNTYFNDVIEKE